MERTNHSGWIYGIRTDVALFIGTILIGLTYASFHRVWAQPTWVFIIFNIGHSYTTNFFTFNSKRLWNEHKNFFLIPIYVLAGILFLLFTLGEDRMWLIFTHYSLFHFMKQQNAWFYISSAKSGLNGQFEKIVTVMTAWSAVFVPQIISMSNGSVVGWFTRGDIAKIPHIFEPLAIIFGSVSLCFYLFMEGRRWIRSREIHWSKHFHLAIGAFIWFSARLEIFQSFSESLGPMLVMGGHSFPYFYLGYRYVKDRREKGDTFFPNIQNYYLFFLLIIIVSFSFTYFQRIAWTV